MKFLIVLPDTKYFLWQMLVQVNNLNKFGYDDDAIYIIGRTNNDNNHIIKKIGKLNTKANFYFYDDNRVEKNYLSSLRPYLLSKFFYEHKEICDNETFFYLDPDVIFIKKINFKPLLKDKTWYVSDTTSYISSLYIKSKGLELFNEMCNIVNISPKLVESNDDNAGGAQYIIKNIDYRFWDKVYIDSENLYNYLTSTQHKSENPIQSWTADMWAVLWNAWYFKYNVKIHKSLDFVWGVDNIDQWENKNIFHNAGVINSKNNLFAKSEYMDSPFNKDLDFVDKTKAVSNYVKEIKETELNFKYNIF